MTTVKLDNNGVEVVFPIDKAEATLRYEAQVGLKNYTLKDENYIFENGVIKRQNSKPDKKSAQSKVDTEGDNPSE